MRKSLVVFVGFMLVACFATADASQNAGSAWNLFAAQHGFATYPQDAQCTFRDAYSGANFDLDFPAIIGRVAQALSSQSPIVGGDDILNTSLENWPDGSGT